MRRFLPALAIGLLFLTTTALHSFCASPHSSPPATEIISSVVKTLQVLSDSCFVFDEPRASPYYFGPLRKGEKVKWLDVQDGWNHVWVPRLRASGWVKSIHVQETEQQDTEPIPIPARLFTRIVVTSRSANIRSDSRARAELLLTARMGQEFLLLNEKGGWYLVWLSDLGRTGWVFGQAVAKQRPR